MKIHGRKEVGEAVVTAGLSALAEALVNWGVEHVKAKAAAPKKPAAERLIIDVELD